MASVDDFDLLTCSICLEDFTEPKILDCHHSFCLNCIEHIQQANPDTQQFRIRCPVCNNITKLSTRGGQDLPNDFRIQQIKDHFKKDCSNVKSKSRYLHDRMCHICKSKRGKPSVSASHHCFQCSLDFCQECMNKHTSNVLLKTHTITRIQDELLLDQVPCEYHQDNCVQFFCEQCVATLCIICLMTHDSNHTFVSLTEALADCQIDIDKLSESLDAKIQAVESRIYIMEPMKNNLSASVLEVETSIHKQTICGIDFFRKEERKLYDEAHTTMGALMTEMGVDKLDDLYEIKNTLRDIKDVLRNGSQLDLLGQCEELKNKAFSLDSSTLPDSRKHLNGVVRFTPDIDISQLKVGEISYESDDMETEDVYIHWYQISAYMNTTLIRDFSEIVKEIMFVEINKEKLPGKSLACLAYLAFVFVLLFVLGLLPDLLLGLLCKVVLCSVFELMWVGLSV